MKAFLVFALVAAFVSFGVEAKKKKADAIVTVLNADNFDSFIAEHDTMVKFFAPWCGHCKALAPEFEKAAVALKSSHAILAEVDCTQSGDLCGRFDVQGYPTVKFFPKGKDHMEYEGERKADAIIGWVKRMMMPAVSVFKTEAEAEAVLDDSAIAALGFFPSDSAVEYKAFSAACDTMRLTLTCVAVLGEKPTAELVVIRREDEGREKFEGEFSADLIVAWAKSAVIPLIAEISQGNARTYVEASVPVAFLYADIKDAAFQSTLKPAFLAVARENRGKLLCTYVDTNKYARMAKSVGLSGNVFPAFVIEAPQKAHYPHSEATPLTEQSMKEFTAKVLAGEIAPFIRSQPVPTTQGDVYTVVGDSFKQVVMDTTKDVLVKFYAPWCGHCKNMKPDYEALAKFFAPAKDKVIIAEMDATENDAPPPISIKGFPTLIFFPANNKANPITYSGARTLDAMREFVLENADLVTAESLAPAAEEKPVEAAPAPEIKQDL